jgi:hypothetical protein
MKMMRTDMTGPTITRRYPLRAFAAGARWLANPVSEAGAKQVPRIHLYANGPEMLAEVERMRTHPTGNRILEDRPDLAATGFGAYTREAEQAQLTRHIVEAGVDFRNLMRATPARASALRRLVAAGADDAAIRAAAAGLDMQQGTPGR